MIHPLCSHLFPERCLSHVYQKNLIEISVCIFQLILHTGQAIIIFLLKVLMSYSGGREGRENKFLFQRIVVMLGCCRKEGKRQVLDLIEVSGMFHFSNSLILIPMLPHLFTSIYVRPLICDSKWPSITFFLKQIPNPK